MIIIRIDHSSTCGESTENMEIVMKYCKGKNRDLEKS